MPKRRKEGGVITSLHTSSQPDPVNAAIIEVSNVLQAVQAAISKAKAQGVMTEAAEMVASIY